MPETDHYQYNVNVGYISIVVDANLQIPAFWAHPQVGGPFPGLILLHDDWGLNEHIRALVHRFAEVGYYVIAPDIFEGNLANSQLEADALENRYKHDAHPKVSAASRALETHHKCNSKIAVVGWDFGADLSIEVGLKRHDIMAAAAFYGNAVPYLDQLKDLHCPVMAIYGDEDEFVKDTIEPVTTKLNSVDDKHEVIVYPGAKHGFYNDMRPDYDEDASKDAWDKLLKFLETHQGKPPPPDEAAPGYFKPGRVY